MAPTGLTSRQTNRHGTGVPGPFFKRIQTLVTENRLYL
ncbi:hypothetical protein SXCC_03963 [Gluconacetobacter sp. SXCC-1]|nr:hypothetical protein SXCC_03963 [Gluconacetobacter sp. SXCC-1]